MAEARQAMQGAQGGQQPSQPPMPPQQQPVAPQAPQAPQGQGLPVPPPEVAMQMAQLAQTLDPMVLGTLIWRALQQHGESLNAQGMNDMGGQPQAPQMPQGMMGQ